jgi:hypothetical protein
MKRFINPSALNLLLNTLASRGGGFMIDKLERLLTGLPSLVIVVMALFVLGGSSNIVRNVVVAARNVRPISVVLSFGAIIIPWAIVNSISNPALPNAAGFSALLHQCLLPPHGKVLLPFVTLTAFWGPAVLLLVFRWNAIGAELRNLGPGVVGVVGVSLPLGLATEPRYITAAWPFLVMGLVIAMEKEEMRTSCKYIFGVLTVLFAQFWMKLNLAPWTGGDLEGILGFPKQVYFMHLGYWMSWHSYLIQLPVVILGGFCLHRACNNTQKRPSV